MDRTSLRRPAREVAARHALALLRTCRKRSALGTEPDPEALHDFRVALRRLRTWLREFHEPLGLPRRIVALRRAARLTGPARDRQVARALLEEAAPRLGSSGRRLRSGLSRKAEAALRRDWARALAGAASAAPELERLAAQLSAPSDDGKRKAFGSLASARVSKRVRALERRLSELGRRPDGPKAHRARIAGKRLRYLLEPLPGSGPVVRELKAGQDRLGRARDLLLLETLLEDAGSDAAGLRSWARRESREAGAGHRRALTGRRGRAFFESARRFARALA